MDASARARRVAVNPELMHEDISRDLYAAVDTLRQSEDFRGYQSYWGRLGSRLSTQAFRKSADQAEPEWLHVREAEWLESFPESFSDRIGRTALVAAAFLVLSTGFLAMNFGVPLPTSGNVLVIAAAGAAAAVSLAVLVVRVVRRRRETLEIRGEVEWAHRKYGEKITEVARELLLSAINRVLGPEGRLPFPASGRWLVESNTSPAVPLRTLEYVNRFIREHESSAIGIAGPRGAGKSTIIAEVHRGVAPEHVRVLIPAPVAYDGHDFLKRLAKKLAFGVVGSERRLARRGSSYLRSPYVTVWGLVMIAGVFIAVSPVTEIVGLPPEFYPVAVGAGIFLFGYLGLALGLMSSRRRLWDDAHVSTAEDLVRWLEYDVAEERSSKVEINALEVITADASNSTTIKRRDASHEALSGAIVSFLGAMASEGRRVYIFVDELDKLSDPKAAIDIINLLKDMFHIPGVHFVVSVSMEALASFELRGVQVRDAFDSSFDTILEVQPMTGSEALAVLESRVAGFPPLAAAACHAWSGGLPRDLLRMARRMIEVNRDSGDASPILNVFRSVLVEDLSTKVNALARSGEIGGSLQGVAQLLVEVVGERRVVDASLTEVLPQDFLKTPLGRRLELGLAWVEYLERSSPGAKTSWDLVGDRVLQVADKVAAAIARSSSGGGLAEEAHLRAITACRAEGISE